MNDTTQQQQPIGQPGGDRYAQFRRDGDFIDRWWEAHQDRPAPLMEALELARLTGADFDDLVADFAVVIETGMVRLPLTPHKAPERAPRVKCVLSDPKTPYCATGGQGDPTQPGGGGYKGPENSAEGRIGEREGKTPHRSSDGQGGRYGAVGEGVK